MGHRKIWELVNIANQINGTNKIHSLVLILKQKGVPFEETFLYRENGLHSTELKLEIDYLKRIGCLSESFEHVITTRKNLGIISRESIQDYGEDIKSLNSLSEGELELIATAFYLENYGYDRTIIKKKLKFLKPELFSENYSSIKRYLTIKA